MESKSYIVNSDSSYVEFEKQNYEDYQEHKYLVVTVRFGRDRTLEQNKMFFELYTRISKSLGDQSIADVRAECKLLIGQPILYNDPGGAEFRYVWDKLMRGLTYEQQLHLMKPNQAFGANGFPITSTFSRKQGIQYIDDIMAKYNQVDFSELEHE